MTATNCRNGWRSWRPVLRSSKSVLREPSWIEKLKNQKTPNLGFNAFTDEYEDLVKAGVIDPTKVTRTALQNAASIASLMLTTEAMICSVLEETEK